MFMWKDITLLGIYSWREGFLQSDWHVSYLVSILLQDKTANSAIMKDTFLLSFYPKNARASSDWPACGHQLLLIGPWSTLPPAPAWHSGHVCWRLSWLLSRSQEIVQESQETGGVRLSALSLDPVTLRSLSRQLWGGSRITESATEIT